jgi:hypothetical protein
VPFSKNSQKEKIIFLFLIMALFSAGKVKRKIWVVGGLALVGLLIAIFLLVFLILHLRTKHDFSEDGKLVNNKLLYKITNKTFSLEEEDYTYPSCEVLTGSRSYDEYWNCLALGPSAVVNPGGIRELLDDPDLKFIRWYHKNGSASMTRPQQRKKLRRRVKRHEGHIEVDPKKGSFGPYVPVRQDFQIHFSFSKLCIKLFLIKVR